VPWEVELSRLYYCDIFACPLLIRFAKWKMQVRDWRVKEENTLYVCSVLYQSLPISVACPVT
jgi:hypothetical protein